jgi:hypothetical protein
MSQGLSEGFHFFLKSVFCFLGERLRPRGAGHKSQGSSSCPCVRLTEHNKTDLILGGRSGLAHSNERECGTVTSNCRRKFTRTKLNCRFTIQSRIRHASGVDTNTRTDFWPDSQNGSHAVAKSEGQKFTKRLILAGSVQLCPCLSQR